MESLVRDLRAAVRQLLKQPGFTFLAVITLALGIGANTAIFTVVNAVLFRPLPYPNEDRLVVMRETKQEGGDAREGYGVSYLNFTDWRATSRSFEAMAVVQANDFTLTGAGDPEVIRGGIVSSDIFAVLGPRPVLGRGFTPEDDIAGGTNGFNGVVLSHGMWQRRFSGDRGAIGQTIKLDDKPYTIVGVMPEGVFPLREELVECWITVAYGGDATKKGTMNGSRGYRAYAAVLARLKPGVSVEQARAEMESIALGLTEKFPESNAKQSVDVTPLRELFAAQARPLLLLLFGIVAAVLLIACVNVANLLLARATVRYREMAIRTVLGASRTRIVRQLLTESIVLGLVSGTLGVLVSMWGIAGLVVALPADVPRITGLSPDWRVLCFTMGVSILTGIVCGLAPAVSASKTDLTEAVKEGGGRGGSAGGKGGALRGSLVVLQIAVSLVLLVGAGLLMRSFIRLQAVDPGFSAEKVLTAKVVLSAKRYQQADASRAMYDRLLERVRALPGVTRASIAQSVPLTSNDNGTNVDIVGKPFPKNDQPEARLRFIGLEYFSTIGIPRLSGRDFSDRDTATAPPVVLVNEAFARKYFPGENPLGQKLMLGWGGDEAKEIVGVVGNILHRGLDDRPRPEMYVPLAQFATSDMTVLVRTNDRPEALAAAVTAAVRDLDPEIPVTDVKTLADYRRESVALPRFTTLVLGAFASLALLLTVIGLYGVVAYSVTRRTHEIGIRLALGATTADVLGLVLGQGMKLTLIGVSIGLAGAILAARSLQSLLFNISATDPATFAGVAVLLAASALVACWLPARRATKVDPMTALRSE